MLVDKNTNVHVHVSSLLIASAILIGSWILVWLHLQPIRVSASVRIIYQMNLRQE